MIDIDHLVSEEYVRRPFVVRAIHVTVENIHEVSELCGELVIPEQENQLPYIKVDPKKLRNRSKVRVGMWITVSEEGIRAHGDAAFHGQFKRSTDEIMGWVEYMAPPTPSDDPALPLG